MTILAIILRRNIWTGVLTLKELLRKIMPLSVKNIKHNIKLANDKFESGKWNLGSQQVWFNEKKKLRMALAVESGEKVVWCAAWRAWVLEREK